MSITLEQRQCRAVEPAAEVTTVKLRCPDCGEGSVDVYEGEVGEPWFSPKLPYPHTEVRVRPCLMAACNACEFVVEIDRHGNVLKS